MGFSGEDRVRPIVWASRILSLLVAVATPAAYFEVCYSRFTDALATDAEVKAQLITRYVNNDPLMWVYEQHRLEGILERDLRPHEREIQRVLDRQGRPAALVEDRPPPPLVTRVATIYDAGNPVASVEISRSLQGVLLRTALVAGLSVMLGFAVYGTMNLIPLAALRRMLQALWEEKERAQVTLSSIAEAVVTTDLRGEIGLLNRVAEELAGISDDEARGRPFGAVFRLRHRQTGEEWVPPWHQGPAADDAQASWLLDDAGGHRRVVTMATAHISDVAGGVHGYVLDMRDVTEQERLELELARGQRLESLGLLAGGIAHDFNNLLMAIMGNVEVASHHAQASPEVTRRLAAATAACERAGDLTQQLLTFARGGAPVRRVVDIAALIRETTEFCSRGSNTAVEIDVAAGLWAVEADEGQISQVLQNLVINAHQATRGAGTVRVCAENVHRATGDDPRLSAGRYVRIAVEDEGVGIAPRDVEHIFDPYFTTKPGGTGLGLSVVYSIVQRHGGTIGVESTVGRGSRFELYLPAGHGVGAALKPSLPAAPEATGRLLLMDDDDLVREAAAEVFSHLGYEVTTTCDGGEALERYAQTLAAGCPFDLVVLDLTVPGGMGGEETVRRLREIHRDAVVVASSGYCGGGALSDYQARGFDQILSKPYRLDDVIETLASLAALREARRTPHAAAPPTAPP